MAEPFSGDENGHFETKTDLGVEKGCNVVVFGKIGNKFMVFGGNFMGFLGVGDTCRVNDSQVASHVIEELDHKRGIKRFHEKCNKI